MNQCHFLGNLTRDPELKTTQGGKDVVNLGVAVNRRYKKGEQTVQEVAYLNCEAWDTGARVIAEHFKKGDPIIIHCSVRQDEWEVDGPDGQKQRRTALKFRINEFEFVGGRKKEAASQSDEPKAAPKAKGKKATVPPENDEDIPF